MSATELRPLDIPDMLDLSFRAYRARFGPMLLIALLPYVPYALLVGWANQMAAPLTQPGFTPPGLALQAPPAGSNPALVGLFLLIGVAFAWTLFVYPIVQAALTVQISSTYLGEPLGALASYAQVLPRLPMLIVAWIAAAGAILVGCVLFIVPGIIFAMWFLLTIPAIVLEGAGPFEALKRSKQLISENLGRGFALVLLTGLMVGFLSLTLQVVVTTAPIPSLFLQQFLLTCLQAVLLPLSVAPPIFLYYDLRVRKEALDLEMLAASLDRA